MNEPRAVSGGRRVFARYSPLKIAGVLYVLAVLQFFVFELVAETLYPGYSVANNYISDLGGTCLNPPSTLHCVVHQPAARIFDTTVVLLGVMFLAGAFFVYLGTRKKLYSASAAVAGVAILLAGVFPEPTGRPHAIVSEVLFYFMGISLILAWTITEGHVIRYLVVAFGALTLFFTAFEAPAGVIGPGGEERLLVLCGLLGLLAVGGYLTGQDSLPAPVKSRRPVSVRPWRLAAIIVTASTTGLIAITIALAVVMTRDHLQMLGMLTLLPNLVLLLVGASIILWIVTAARWLTQRWGRGVRSRTSAAPTE